MHHAAIRAFDPDQDEHPVKYLVSKISNPGLYATLHTWLQDDIFGETIDDPKTIDIPVPWAEPQTELFDSLLICCLLSRKHKF